MADDDGHPEKNNGEGRNIDVEDGKKTQACKEAQVATAESQEDTGVARECSSRLPTRKWTRHLRQRPRARGRLPGHRQPSRQCRWSRQPCYSLKDRIDVICSPFIAITDAK